MQACAFAIKFYFNYVNSNRILEVLRAVYFPPWGGSTCAAPKNRKNAKHAMRFLRAPPSNRAEAEHAKKEPPCTWRLFSCSSASLCRFIGKCQFFPRVGNTFRLHIAAVCVVSVQKFMSLMRVRLI